MISIDDVRAAAARIEGVAHRTPVLTSRTLDGQVGATVFLKAESFQRSGSFKLRGAYNTIAALAGPEAAGERPRAVVAYSSGNHAQAVAVAAATFGLPAVIVMPEDAPASKRAATEGYGAEVITYDRYTGDRAAIGAAVAEERSAILVPPYEHPLVMAGQGTAALELLGDVGALDVLAVPVGGGGLAAGSATTAAALAPGCRVVGVEPEAGDDTRQSFHKGERVRIPIPKTIADGQQIDIPGEMTFEVNRRLLHDVVTVTDDEIVATMRFLLERLKIVVEPSGASALAAVLHGHAGVRPGERVGVILSGGNVDAVRLGHLLAREAATR